MRNGGPVSIASKLNGKHPLETRLEKWEETQMDFKLEGLRRTYGAGEPIRRAMELEIVKATHKVPQALGGQTNNLHRHILENNEHSVDWEDVYPGENNFLDFHSEMEKKMGI
jgi:proteasome maturation protein